MRHFAILGPACSLLLVACAAKKPITYVDLNSIRRPLPIAIVDVANVNTIDGELTMANLVKDQTKVKELLCNVWISTTVSKYDTTGNLKFAVGNVAGEIGQYKLVQDWMIYTPQTTNNKYSLVGCGIRLTAEISTGSENLDVSSLANLGLQIKNKHMSGSIIIEAIGIDSDDVRVLTPFSATIDEVGIAKTNELLTSIKSKISGQSAKSVKFFPKKFAEMPSDNPTPEDRLRFR